MTKTTAAFLLTADRLFQPGEKVFFWTFTFNVIHSDAEGSALFSEFLNHLQKVLKGDWGGVKVAELHKEHGIHFHALINRRLAVDIVRRVARCHGLGRIHVERAWTDEEAVRNGKKKGAAAYLSKYLTKQQKQPIKLCKDGKIRSLRRWSAFGKIRHTRISDLVNDYPEWIFRRAHNLPFTTYHFEHFLRVCWLRGEQTFKSAYFAAASNDIATVIAAAEGKIVPDGAYGWKQRFRPTLTPF